MDLLNKNAPEFTAKALIEGKEKTISLKDFLGKKIVLYFYPKDMTPGCTTQGCNLRDNYPEFKKRNIVILGVSVDSIKSHLNFAQKKELPFILVSDEDKTIVNKYGVWGPKTFLGKKYIGTSRKTFLINEKGVITYIIEKPDVNIHSEEILKLFFTTKK